MTYKDIIVPILDAAVDEAALRAGEVIAGTDAGRLQALYLEIEPEPVAAPGGFVFAEAEQQLSQRLQKEAMAARLALQERPWSRRIDFATLRTRPSFMQHDIAGALRCADLTILRRPGNVSQDGVRAQIFEVALLKAGRPVLLAPPEFTGSIGRRVLVAWSGTRESARALGDAAPFLDRADQVVIAIVATHRQNGDNYGADIVAHLSHRGVKAEVHCLMAKPEQEGEALLGAAREMAADLVVMGGYGHTLAAEIIFGGVTRSLSRSSTIPLLLSH